MIENHKDPDEEVGLLLPWYLNGALGPEETRRVEEWLHSSPQAQAQLESWRRMRLAVGGQAPLAPPARVFAGVMERVRRPAARPSVWQTLRRWSAATWLGAVALTGIVLVLSDRLTLAGVGAGAIALNLLATAGITAGTLWQKRHGAAVDLRTGAIVQFAASFVVLLPFALAFETLSFDLVWEFWVALAWSVLALSIVAIFLLLTMIRHGRATQVASYMYLTPPTTALMAWGVFGERLGPLAWVGVLLAMAGVALVVTRRTEPKTQPSGIRP